MPFALTHALASILCVDLYRKFFARHGAYFTRYTLFVAALAGLLPDIDIPLDLITDQFGYDLEHGGFTHTPFFALIFLLPGFYFWMRKKQIWGMYFFASVFAMLVHIFLDRLLSPYSVSGILLFYPFSDYAIHIGLLGAMDNINTMEFYAALDAIVLLLALVYAAYRLKISRSTIPR